MRGARAGDIADKLGLVWKRWKHIIWLNSDRKMKKLFFIIGLVGLVSLSVAGTEKRELTTQVSVDYTLPKISYDVVVTMECSRLIPGLSGNMPNNS